MLDRNLAPRVDANLLTGDPGVSLDRHRQVRDTGQPAVVEHQSGGIRLHTMLLPVRSAGTDDGVLEVTFVAGRLEADLLGENYKIALRGSVLVRPPGPRRLGRASAPRAPAGRRPDAGHRARRGRRVPRAGPGPDAVTSWGRWRAAFNRMTERLDEARRRVEAETDRSLELMRRLRQTESLDDRRQAVLEHRPRGRDAAEHHRRPRRADAPRAAEGLAAPGGPRHHRHPDRPDLPDDPGGPGSVPSSESPSERLSRRSSVIDGLRPLLQHFAKGRGVSLAVSVPRATPKVHVDAGHLQQVLINLLTNAIEATPSGGRVEVTGASRADERSAGGRPRRAGHRVGDSAGRASPDLRPLLQHQVRS